MSLNFANYPRLEIPEGRVKQIARKSDGLVLWDAGYINMVPLSIDTDGSIYNGVGYKNGYRIRSGGAEGVQNNATCTGFIPVKGGDVVRFSGWTFDYAQNGNAINVADASLTNIGQFTMLPAHYGIFQNGYSEYVSTSVVEETEGVWKWVVPPAASGVAYIRVSGFDNSGSPAAKMIVTVNEEIL